MKINPPPTKIIIFSGGGGMIERIQTIAVVPGLNQFEIENVPAAFDPSTTMVFFTKTSSDVNLMQVDVRRPDKKIVENFIKREQTAASTIIQNATDLRGNNRDMIIQLLESAHYRRYEDMPGTIVVSLDVKTNQEIGLGIRYFLEDARIKWEPSVHIKLDENKGTATIEGFILAMNNTDISYPPCEVVFAEFEMKTEVTDRGFLDDLEMEQQAQSVLPQNRMVAKVQKMKNLLM
jgi:hypothetical protein